MKAWDAPPSGGPWLPLDSMDAVVAVIVRTVAAYLDLPIDITQVQARLEEEGDPVLDQLKADARNNLARVLEDQGVKVVA